MSAADHIDRIELAADRIEALSVALWAMGAANVSDELVSVVAHFAAELAAGVRGEAAALHACLHPADGD